jgi:aubergine-like protein
MVEIYSETFKRGASMEYDLGDAMYSTVSNALKCWNVSPASCIVWRDGVGDGAVAPTAAQEIPAVRKALAETSPGTNPALAYIVVQKRIATKFVTTDGENSAPPGTLISGIQGLEHSTFYINGTCPSFATAKPVRFIVASQDKGLEDTKMLAELSWALCHDYPNWAGPVKVPGPVQLAHKAAEVRNLFLFCSTTQSHFAHVSTILNPTSCREVSRIAAIRFLTNRSPTAFPSFEPGAGGSVPALVGFS